MWRPVVRIVCAIWTDSNADTVRRWFRFDKPFASLPLDFQLQRPSGESAVWPISNWWNQSQVHIANQVEIATNNQTKICEKIAKFYNWYSSYFRDYLDLKKKWIILMKLELNSQNWCSFLLLKWIGLEIENKRGLTHRAIGKWIVSGERHSSRKCPPSIGYCQLSSALSYQGRPITIALKASPIQPSSSFLLHVCHVTSCDPSRATLLSIGDSLLFAG